jgi:hypothetical protein
MFWPERFRYNSFVFGVYFVVNCSLVSANRAGGWENLPSSLKQNKYQLSARDIPVKNQRMMR